MQLSKDGQKVIGKKIKLSCDSLGVSGGWTPAVHLFTQSGGKLKFRENDQVFIPNKYPSDQLSIGSCNGDFSLEEITTNTILSCLLYTSPSPRDKRQSRMPSSA